MYYELDKIFNERNKRSNFLATNFDDYDEMEYVN